MAAIDKIYGTADERQRLWSWCVKNLPQALDYIYDARPDLADDTERVIANFPEYIDRRLWRECPERFVAEALMEQYPPQVLKVWGQMHALIVKDRVEAESFAAALEEWYLRQEDTLALRNLARCHAINILNAAGVFDGYYYAYFEEDEE